MRYIKLCQGENSVDICHIDDHYATFLSYDLPF